MAIVEQVLLFPPIIETYFSPINIESLQNNGYITIPFSVNELNSIADIKDIHVTITRQSNYHSIFDKTNYPLGIYTLDKPTITQYKGVITIPLALGNNKVLNIDEINFNEYYKVQLRFSSEAAKSGNNRLIGRELSTFLLNDEYLNNAFSEWSRVGLIRFIAPPKIKLLDNNTTELSNTASINTIADHYVSLTGSLYKEGSTTINSVTFNHSNDNEYLSSWQISVLDNSDNILTDSGVQYNTIRGNKINNFQYNIPFYFETNTIYKLKLTITTANLYSQSYIYTVRTTASENSWGSQTQLNEYTSLDSVIGKVNITFEVPEDQTPPSAGKLIIRRASADDNFLYWETLWQKNNIAGITSEKPISYDDFTIESGTIYRYHIIYINSSNQTYSIMENCVLSVFDHAFLTGEGTQLCVKFNPNISNVKINVSDNMLNTIGGKYPFINRNGNMYYRSFSLSGTIAYEMDVENQFATRSSIYGDWISVYGSYFVNRYINQQNDRITQRKFREIVMNYLYDDIPKLFWSTPEGNILVRLTDVNLTPKQELGRMIYDFSCVATEIGDCSIDNYKLYKIQDFGDM